MRRKRQYDEVMIVNPAPPGADPARGERIMMGYYGNGGWGQSADEYEYADAPYQVSADEMAGLAGWGDPYGCGCQHRMGHPAFADPYGLAGWVGGAPWGFADPYGYAAPFGYGGPWGRADADPYGQSYDLEGWGAYDDYADDPDGAFEDGELGDDPSLDELEAYGWYGADDMDDYDMGAYVPDEPSPHNYTIPNGVAGYGGDDLEGYVKPVDVSPTCQSFQPPPGPTGDLPDTLRPLW
jgi:hypothetical protein